MTIGPAHSGDWKLGAQKNFWGFLDILNGALRREIRKF